MMAAIYQRPWPPSPDGKYRVATYRGNYDRTPIVYHPADYFDHRTLKAACRRLSGLIFRQGKNPPKVRYDAMYIITPSGERLSLRDAQARLS